MNPENVLTAFLLGKEFTYVVMKAAISFAERGLKVWCICMEPLKEIPSNIPRPEKEVLQLIIFIYLKTRNDLIRHLNSTHNWHHQNQPDVIILSSFEAYCNLYNSTYDSLVTAYVCAMLLDSASTCSKKKNSNRKCYVIVTCLEKIHENVSTVIKKECTQKLQVIKDMYFEKFLYRKDFENDDLFVKDILNYYFVNTGP